MNKVVKYFTIDFGVSNNVTNWCFIQISQTNIENFRPRKIHFHNDCCFVSYDDSTKVYFFDDACQMEVKPQLLDIIHKPYGAVLDFKFSEDSKQIYVLDYIKNDEYEIIRKVNIFYLNVEEINLDPQVSVVQKFRPVQVTQPLE